MAEVTYTLRLEEDLKEEFTAAAEAGHLKAAQVLRELMRRYVREQRAAAKREEAFELRVKRSLAAARRGELVDNEVVEAESRAWLAQVAAEIKPAKRGGRTSVAAKRRRSR
jgi:predicted transcriptional regulator